MVVKRERNQGGVLMEFVLRGVEGSVQTDEDRQILENHKTMEFKVYPAMRFDRERNEFSSIPNLDYRVITFDDGAVVNCIMTSKSDF